MRAIIIASGVCSADFAVTLYPKDVVIAVDGGYRHCVHWHIRPHVVIGDMDSLSNEDMEAISLAGIPMHRHPPRKDQTDLELALEYAVGLGADTILLLAVLGARWDMTLGNVMVLRSPKLSGIAVRIIDGLQEIFLIRERAPEAFFGKKGDILSLIPLTSEVTGVSTAGLEYPLRHETLYAGSTRGVSNVFLEETAMVSFEKGLMLCVIHH